jgi:hypothetical protein
MEQTMNVGDLKKVLENVDDETELIFSSLKVTNLLNDEWPGTGY